MLKYDKKEQKLYVKIGTEWHRLRKTVKQLQRASELDALKDAAGAEAGSVADRLQKNYRIFLGALHFGLNPDLPEKEVISVEQIEAGMDADEIERAGYAYIRYFMDPNGDLPPFVVQTD